MQDFYHQHCLPCSSKQVPNPKRNLVGAGSPLLVAFLKRPQGSQEHEDPNVAYSIWYRVYGIK